MKILVTGGAGFIGSALVRFLITRTSAQVVNVDILTYAANLESLADTIESDRYSFEQVDICDKANLVGVFRSHNPDAVIHLAAESHVDRSIEGPDAFLRTNVLGTGRLLQVATEYWGSLAPHLRSNFRFLHVSTDEVFGDLPSDGSRFCEATPYAPSSPYAATKAASDHLVRAWWRTYQLPVVITNCSNNYGPYQFPEKLIPHMILTALAEKPLPVYGDGLQIRDWLHVEDHVRALWAVLGKGRVGETYTVGGSSEQRNIDVVRMICSLLQERAPPRTIARYSDLITHVPDRPGHDARYAINPEKIERELGWKPRETFESGLRRTVGWYLENREWWERVLNGAYTLKRIGEGAQVL